MIERLPDLLSKGRVHGARGFEGGRRRGRIYLTLDGGGAAPDAAVVRLDWNGQPFQWVVTAFEDRVGSVDKSLSDGGVRPGRISNLAPQDAPSAPDATGQPTGKTDGSPDQDEIARALAEARMADDFEFTDDAGNTFSASQLLDDLDADAEFAEALSLCAAGGGAA